MIKKQTLHDCLFEDFYMYALAIQMNHTYAYKNDNHIWYLTYHIAKSLFSFPIYLLKSSQCLKFNPIQDEINYRPLRSKKHDTWCSIFQCRCYAFSLPVELPERSNLNEKIIFEDKNSWSTCMKCVISSKKQRCYTILRFLI